MFFRYINIKWQSHNQTKFIILQSVIAPKLHTSSHLPHPTHLSGSIIAFFPEKYSSQYAAELEEYLESLYDQDNDIEILYS